jgi:hypothetical protein
MEITTQKPKVPGWKIGAFFGFVVFLVGSGMYFSQMFEKWHVGASLLVLSCGLIGLCAGGLVGMRGGINHPPRWFIFGSRAVVFPGLLFGVFTIPYSFFSSHRWNGWDSLAVLLVIMVFPIMFFIGGALASSVRKIRHIIVGYAVALLVLFIVSFFGIGWDVLLVVWIVLGPVIGKCITKFFRKDDTHTPSLSIDQGASLVRKGVIRRFFDYFLK